MAPFRPSRDLSSLRFKLPLLLLLYCSALALVLYVVADQVQERRFEESFEQTQLLRATEIQSRTERAAERSEIEAGQREFGELGVFEELRAAVFVSPDNDVVLSSRRDWLGRPLDLTAFGLSAGERTRVEAAMTQARATGHAVSQFSDDRNALTIMLPAAVPLGPGDLRVDRRALILLVHDLGFAKSVNRFRLRQQFGVAMIGVLVAALGLGFTLHFFVTRRIEYLHGVMARFASGESIEDVPVPVSRRADEISHVFRHFSAIAATINREISVRRQAEDALRESEERFRSAMKHSPIGTALVSTDGRFVEVNPALCAILGYTREELLATTFRALTHPDDLDKNVDAMRQLLSRDVDTYQTIKRYFHKDGRVLWAQLNASVVYDEAGGARYFVSKVQDITERKRADEELRRVNRALRTISNCNQVLVHATDETALLRQVCNLIVTDGGYRMAWVGLADPDSDDPVQPVTHAGFEDGYLEEVPMSSADDESGGPTVTAIRTGRPSVCHDFLSDPDAGPWSEEAITRGYKSALALPLESEGRVFGALTIYSGDEVAFDIAEITLLRELADDLSFGIQALRTRINRHRAERALESSEALLRQFIKYTPAAVAMFDTEMRYISASDRWLADYGLAGKEIIGQSHYEMFPNVKEEWKAVHRRVLAGAVERCDEDTLLRPDGRLDWLEWEVRPWRTPDGVIGGLIIFAQVITARKRSEQAFRESQSKLVMAMDMAGLAHWELDAETGLLTFDERMLTQLGTTLAREGGLTMPMDQYVKRFIPHGDRAILREFAARAESIEDPRYAAQLEHRVARVDGSTGVVQVRALFQKDAAGRVVRVIGANLDITERKRAAAEVVAMNERYARQEAALITLMRRYASAPDDFAPIVREVTEVVARTLEVAQAGVWRHDDRGTSTQCLDLFVWPDHRHSSGAEITEEACPSFFAAIAGADVIAVHDATKDARTSELAAVYLTPQGITSMMSVAIRSQGTTVGVLSCQHTGAPRRWTPDEQTFALAVANFLSAITAQVERQRLEQQLRQAQKLEAIGQLAGGVAHDFNNILTVILGRAEEVSADARLPGDVREAAVDISQNAERATALTRQLLAFSRRQTMQVKDVDMNTVVDNLTRMLDRILGEDVVLEFHYSDRPAHVRADPGMIEQVLLNLAVNARDAMPFGGHLTIDTVVVDAGGPVRSAGSWVCLQVTDTGSGIPTDHLPHIFEPFFTTKDVGKGTGLGLATTYGIVQQHGGWIEVESEVDRGTTFRVFFPHVTVAAVQASAPVAAPSPSPRGDETILVVEDEDGVRALVIKVLEDLGYRLLQAPSGPRALDVWRDHGPGIDMLITDIVMPDGMNGIELAERLRRSSPSLKVIFTSGYLADVSRDDIPSRETDAYLAKPFSLPELARLVRRTLDAREAAPGREGSR
jgi:PAS domain S-box-containing protein